MRFLVNVFSGLGLLLAIAATSPASAQTSDQPKVQYFTEIPDGWRSEVIPFPLSFAPSIPYRGTEEILFMPGMFKPEADDFLSYAFLWVVEGDNIPDVKTVRRHMVAYYQGLQNAILKDQRTNVTAKVVNFRIREQNTNQTDDAGLTGTQTTVEAAQYIAWVEWIEPFQSKEKQHLILLTDFWKCPGAGQWRAFFKVMPTSAGGPKNPKILEKLDNLSYERCPAS